MAAAPTFFATPERFRSWLEKHHATEETRRKRLAELVEASAAGRRIKQVLASKTSR